MNMFRDLTMCALIALGVGIAAWGPETWTWPSAGGPYLVQAITFLADTRPLSTIMCFVLAIALFMTRLKY